MKTFLRSFLRRSKKGFTLVELIVVIAIVAILTAVSIAGYYGFLAYSNQSAADQEATQFKTAIMSRMSLSYKGKTSSISSIVGVSSNKGIRIYSEVGDEHPEAKSLSLLGEAYTYVEAPALFNQGGFNIDWDGIVFVNGEKTDGTKPAIYTPKILEENNDGNITYYITGVTYQSKNGYESKVEFANTGDSYDLVISNVNPTLTPTKIEVVGGLKESYYANEVIDTSNIKAVVTFNDSEHTSAVVGSESLDIEVRTIGGSPAHKTLANVVKYSNTTVIGENREVIVKYRNSSGIEVSNASDANRPQYKEAQTINVVSKEVNVTKPANILESERVKNIDPDKESGFYRPNADDPDIELETKEFNAHYVGKANEFRFEPKVTVIENGKAINIIPENAEISHKLYEENDLTSEVGNAFKYQDDNHMKLKFNDELADGFYVLRTTVYGKSFDTNLKIIKGYNAYDARDLKKMDNQNPYNAQNNGNDKYTHQLDYTYLSPFIVMPVEGGTFNDLENTSDPQFCNAFKGKKFHDGEGHYNKGEDLAYDGMILQNNIKLTGNMFHEHFINQVTGKFAYHASKEDPTKYISPSIFRRSLDKYQHYTFEGNYFTIDATNLPLRETNGITDGGASINMQLFGFGYNYDVAMGGNIDENGFEYYKSAEFNRVKILGNTPKSSNPEFLGGFKGIVIYCLTSFTSKYVNMVNTFMMGEVKPNSCGMKMSYSKCFDGWNNAIDFMAGGLVCNNARHYFQTGVRDDALLELNPNVYQALENKATDKNGVYYALNQGNEIKKCDFRNFGGPVFLQQAWATSVAAETTLPQVDIVDSKLESIVGGTEAWFVSNGVTNEPETLKMLARAFPSENNHYSIVNGDQKFDLINVVLTNAGIESSFTHEGGVLPNFGADNGLNGSASYNTATNVVGYDTSKRNDTKQFVDLYTDDANYYNPTYNINPEYDQDNKEEHPHYIENGYIEATTYMSIDHTKYHNIDHTTFGKIGIGAYTTITKGTQYYQPVDSSDPKNPIPTIVSNTSYTEVSGYNTTATYTGMSLTTFGDAFPGGVGYSDDENNIHIYSDVPTEIFNQDEQYLGFESQHLKGLSFVFGVFH